jgi:hypothetical protein
VIEDGRGLLPGLFAAIRPHLIDRQLDEPGSKGKRAKISIRDQVTKGAFFEQ